jgi:hypothetical protein
MFPSTRRPSATTAGRSANRPSSRTMRATALLAALPLPMAIPRSATFSARTSFTPSPVIATVWPRACNAHTRARFCSGVTLPKTAWLSATSASASPSSGRRRASYGCSAPASPSLPAMAPTVRALSPEMTLTVTPCSANHRSVAAASGRTGCSSTTTATGSSPAGSCSPRRASARASSSTRRPEPVCRSTACSAGSPAGSRTSGAPKTHVPWSMKLTALHFRVEEKGTESCRAHPGSVGNAALTASRLGPGAGSAAASAASASSTDGSAVSGVTRLTLVLGSVSVPVLSTHTVSTWARPSMAGSSCTRTRRRPRRTTPTAKAMLVSSTSPSGTMVTTPATAPSSDPRRSWELSSWLLTSSREVGTRNHVTQRRTRSRPDRSAERTSENRRACRARSAAYACRPTRTAR